MYGAILGDIIGSPYEFDRGGKTKEFPLFSENSEFTDDTVMTIAVAEAFLDMRMGEDDEVTFDSLVYYLREWGRKYPNAGYGVRFSHWLAARWPKPYGSFGNGSAMRVSPCGLIAHTLEEALELGEQMRVRYKEKQTTTRRAVIFLRCADDGWFFPLLQVYGSEGVLLFETDLPKTIDLMSLGEIQVSAKRVTVKPRQNSIAKYLGLKPITFHY